LEKSHVQLASNYRGCKCSIQPLLVQLQESRQQQHSNFSNAELGSQARPRSMFQSVEKQRALLQCSTNLRPKSGDSSESNNTNSAAACLQQNAAERRNLLFKHFTVAYRLFN
jgi:hypothetical protein